MKTERITDVYVSARFGYTKYGRGVSFLLNIIKLREESLIRSTSQRFG
ncbi:uncharacterized protein METZ01_LOCUS303597 [marine metagenome]|uniref:Uncharacterized protein n=1 Tax=marine metagenome TaxID=408172 RepID=A0A382MP28_9ZZZZ